jgi:two-component system sensor histidine kinase DegS
MRDSRIYASIHDNGKGFDLEKVLHPESPEGGFGIIGIKERVSLLGGQIDIQSRPGFGTLISIEIPYGSVRD